MAKKDTTETSSPDRLSRREVLLNRKAQQESRQVRLVVGSIVGIIAIVLIAGILLEFVIRPSQPVATVNGDEITLVDFQERVVYERAQVVAQVEDLTAALGGDIAQVQQFAGQQLTLLLDPELLGQQVLDRMVEEVLIRQEAERRGITVTAAEIDERLGERFGYFGGDSPTPIPTGTATVQPTPSITPLATPTIEGAPTITPTATLAATPTAGPTSTPRPTATPVSAEVFDERLNEQLARLQDLGVSEELFRRVVEAELYRTKVLDVLADEAELPTEGVHASFYILFFDDQDEADRTVADIASSSFLDVWNSIRSVPAPAEGEEPVSTAFATEVLWRTRQDLLANLDAAVLDYVFDGPLNQPSEIFETIGQSGLPQYVIVDTSGREIRPFTEARISSDREAVLEQWLAEQSISGVTRNELWRSRVPQNPSVPPEYYQAQPTAAAPIIPGS